MLLIYRIPGETTQQSEFTGIQTERPRLIRRNTFTKLEGDITTETTSSVDFKSYDAVERTSKVRPKENTIVLGEETFHVSLFHTRYLVQVFVIALITLPKLVKKIIAVHNISLFFYFFPILEGQVFCLILK